MRAPWTPKAGNETEKVREVSFTLSLTAPMGPKHSAVIETQVRIYNRETANGKFMLSIINLIGNMIRRFSEDASQSLPNLEKL